MASPDLEQWVRSWLEKRDADTECSVCGTNDWALGEIGEITVQGIRRSIYPVLPLFCGNCGHVVLFNALMMGLVGGIGEPPLHEGAPAHEISEIEP